MNLARKELNGVEKSFVCSEIIADEREELKQMWREKRDSTQCKLFRDLDEEYDA
jgi:hypothetical protein